MFLQHLKGKETLVCLSRFNFILVYKVPVQCFECRAKGDNAMYSNKIGHYNLHCKQYINRQTLNNLAIIQGLISSTYVVAKKKKSAFTWPFLFLLGSEIELLNSQIPLNSLQILIKNLFGLKVGPSSAKITTNTPRGRVVCLLQVGLSVAALHPSTLMWHIGRAPPYYHVPGSFSSAMVGQVYIWNYPEFPKSFPD